jgi:BirA family transcriptional regulator, biotin operon repressor / biotin---[acetyl-CoA-carboxylase] ligase
MELDRSARAAGVRLVLRDTVGSTNAEALALARAGEPGPLWIAARRQTTGRGRRGRSWVSEAGNLYATLLLVDPAPPPHAPELSFVAALAAHDAVAELAPSLAGRLAVKWPNDLLVDAAKLAGVLVEGETRPGRGFAVAIGFGLNCAHHPDATAYPATDLAALGEAVDPQRAFAALSAAMLRRLKQWDQGRGFAAVRGDWLARARGVGAPIRVRTAQGELRGVFAALDRAGRLIVAAADGSTQAVAAGEVFPVGLEPAPRGRVLP